MGQKVHPYGFRLGANLGNNWNSLFFANKRDYSDIIISDIRIRKLIQEQCFAAQISNILIERPSRDILILNIYAKRPGVIIGKSGSDIESLKKKVSKIFLGNDIFINVHEVKRPDLDAAIVSSDIAGQIEKRVSFRTAMKRAIRSTMKQGAKGIKVSCSGRLGGAEIARTEKYKEGRVPLHTLRANISYAYTEAHTTYGLIAVRVWIYVSDYNAQVHNVTKNEGRN